MLLQSLLHDYKISIYKYNHQPTGVDRHDLSSTITLIWNDINQNYKYNTIILTILITIQYILTIINQLLTMY